MHLKSKNQEVQMNINIHINIWKNKMYKSLKDILMHFDVFLYTRKFAQMLPSYPFSK